MRKTEQYILIHLCQCPLCEERQERLNLLDSYEERYILEGTGMKHGADVTRLNATSHKDPVGHKPRFKLHLLITWNELFGKENHRVKAIEILLTCFSNLPLQPPSSL